MDEGFDAVVVGGGFYGAAVATYLAGRRRLRRVALLEKEQELLSRASYANQARIHNGYHYPRSFTTAYRSRVNFPRFAAEYAEAVREGFTKVYAVARHGSKVTAGQFARFCRNIGASLAAPPPRVRALFDWRLVEQVFVVREAAFDATALRARAWRDLRRCGVEVITGARVEALHAQGARTLVHASLGAAAPRALAATHVFNCTYSGLNRLRGAFRGVRTGLKHEITELALVSVPGLEDLGITVMDGPFFSVMPFPARGLHSLSHVRYTPHRAWAEDGSRDPYAELASHGAATRFERMRRDAARYLPALAAAQHRESLFEVKTVLARNETDDGRPILFESHPEFASCHSILGSKIDNIYDVLERLDAIALGEPAAVAT